MRQGIEWRMSIGIILIIAGVSIGGIFKTIIGINTSLLSKFIVVISTLLIVDYKKVMELKYRKFDILMWPIFLYSVVTLLISFVQGYSFFSNIMGVGYQLIYFVQIILLWNSNEIINKDKLIETAFWMLGITSLLTIAVLLYNASITGSVFFNELMSKTNSASAVTRATTAYIAYIGFITTLSYNKTKWKKTRLFFIMVTLVIMLVSMRRTVMVVAILFSIMYYASNKKHEKSIVRYSRRMILFCCGAFIILFLYTLSPLFQNTINRSFMSLVRGIQTYLGLSNVDISANMRRVNIESLPYEYLFNSTLVQFLFGRGYGSGWCDIPYMQAFWELGFIGGLVYLFIQGIIPICHILRTRNNDCAIMFAKGYAILTIIENFANGIAYGNFFPIVLLYIISKIDDSEVAERM